MANDTIQVSEVAFFFFGNISVQKYLQKICKTIKTSRCCYSRIAQIICWMKMWTPWGQTAHKNMYLEFSLVISDIIEWNITFKVFSGVRYFHICVFFPLWMGKCLSISTKCCLPSQLLCIWCILYILASNHNISESMCLVPSVSNMWYNCETQLQVFVMFFSPEEDQTRIHVCCVSISNINVSAPICVVLTQ